ncbi:MAG TPA: DsbA family oxidoreductase [Candidatus Aquabacterium excrementipullorum]|nr:DsbA family oxidoreductase [Candidatus Aquabacterium excrementipullorum]
MKIDFVSDVSCPWCAIGLKALEEAIERIGPSVSVEIHFQPFELNPDMPAGGQDITEHLVQKYGITPEQADSNREGIRQRGRQVGFDFNMERRGRIYNTFDAHRLLHWAGLQGRQRELKHALFETYFTEGMDPSDHGVLTALAVKVGLNQSDVRELLAGDAFAQQVREHERFYAEQGIRSVPSVIINDRHLIQGGQPVELFEQALRQIVAEG